MDLEEAIKTRRTIRSYQDREIPTELILKAISLSCWAPNPGNAQSWKFFVVKDRQVIQRLADALQSKADLLCGWPEAEEFGEAARGYQRGASSLLRTAPVVIGAAFGGYAGLADKILARRGEGDLDARQMIRNREETSTRVQTISGAVAYLLLALHSLGLGGCWMGGSMLARRELEQVLGVPQGFELFTLVPVGYPDESPVPGPRKPLEGVVRII